MNFDVLDITRLTCGPHERRRTTVSFLDFDGSSKPWLTLGPASIDRRSDRTHDAGSWVIESRFFDGTTDVDHSTCVALRMPLVGLALQFVNDHTSMFVAYIDGNHDDGRHDLFRVPEPSWDPRKADGAYRCDACTGARRGHIVVPDQMGMYIPKFNQRLYNEVCGRRVQIELGYEIR